MRYASFLYIPLVQAWKCLIFYDQCINTLCLPLGVFLRIPQYSSFPSMLQRIIPATHGMRTRYQHMLSSTNCLVFFSSKECNALFCPVWECRLLSKLLHIRQGLWLSRDILYFVSSLPMDRSVKVTLKFPSIPSVALLAQQYPPRFGNSLECNTRCVP